jgi:putative salt-induced outer membrane protein YdiY
MSSNHFLAGLRLLGVSLAVFFASGIAVSAQADQVIMKNGDVITGKVSRIADGKVWIQPSYADEFGVATADVEKLDAELQFEVELAEHEKVDGQFQLSAEGQQQLVVDGVARPVDLATVAQAVEPDPYYTRDSHAEVLMTINSGNTDSQSLLLYGDTRIKLGEHRHYADITFRRDETDNIKTKEQDLFNYNYNWLFNEPWFMGGSFTYERDPIKDLEHRYTAGLLFGRDIFDDAGRFLSVSFGVGYSDQEQAGISDSGAVGLWKLFYTQDLVDGKISLYHNHDITYQSYGENDLIFKSNTGLRYDIFKDIYLTTSLRYDYETEPAVGASKDDLTFGVGLGASF